MAKEAAGIYHQLWNAYLYNRKIAHLQNDLLVQYLHLGLDPRKYLRSLIIQYSHQSITSHLSFFFTSIKQEVAHSVQQVPESARSFASVGIV
jgi:hypothetical protein